MNPSRKLLFFALYLVYFLDMAGIGVVYVLFAPLIVDEPQKLGLAALSLENRNLILGFLYAAYPLFQFFGAPLLGEISDRHGRRLPLLFSTLVTAVAFSLSGLAIFCGSLGLLFFSRIFAGLGAGNLTIALASVADFVPEVERPSKMGTFNMIGGVSWIVGPFIGSLLSDSKILPFFSFSTPFWVMALFLFLSAFLVLKAYPKIESRGHGSTIQFSRIFKDLWATFQIPKVSSLLAISILSIFSWMNYQGFMAPYLAEKYHFSGVWIGGIFAYFSVWWFFGGLLANKILHKGHSPSRINIYPMLIAPLAIFSFVFVDETWWIGIATVVANVSESLTVSCFYALFSIMAAKEVQGKIFGCWNAGFALSSAIAPVIGGGLSFFNINAPFGFAAAAHFVAFYLYFLWNRRLFKLNRL